MIDLEHEALVPLREVPRRLPVRANGKRLHISAVYRWVTRGVRGFVLESIRVAGTTYTSVEALQRFAEAQSHDGTDRTQRLSQTRQQAINEASERVRRELGLPASDQSRRTGQP